jgi:hypothetical protein
MDSTFQNHHALGVGLMHIPVGLVYFREVFGHIHILVVQVQFKQVSEVIHACLRDARVYNSFSFELVRNIFQTSAQH